jgi:DNA-binding GntR family transcriptional regulator
MELRTSGIRSTREQIMDALRNDVVSGRLATGERVSEASLVERFGVSRGPIREALSQLASEGLVIARPNCGVVVAPPAPLEVRELILPIRERLECYAIRRIAAGLKESDFADWDQLLLRMDIACRQGDAQALPQLDIELHRRIMELADQPDLLAIWNATVTRMRAHFWETVKLHAQQGRLAWMYQHHRELIDAFRSRDPATCDQALRMHIAEN